MLLVIVTSMKFTSVFTAANIKSTDIMQYTNEVSNEVIRALVLRGRERFIAFLFCNILLLIRFIKINCGSSECNTS